MSTRPFTLKQAHGAVDRMWKKALHDSGGKPTCCKGCFACCYEPVLVSMEEVKLIVKKIPADQAVAVKDRTQAWYQKFAASPLIRNPHPHVMDYKALNLACPLLDTKGNCLVYEDRPMCCRTHTALGPPELCTTDRLKQTYAQSRDMDLLISGILFCDGVKADHLGIFLHRLLFASQARSAAADLANKVGQPMVGTTFGVTKQ